MIFNRFLKKIQCKYWADLVNSNINLWRTKAPTYRITNICSFTKRHCFAHIVCTCKVIFFWWVKLNEILWKLLSCVTFIKKFKWNLVSTFKVLSTVELFMSLQITLSIPQRSGDFCQKVWKIDIWHFIDSQR